VIEPSKLIVSDLEIWRLHYAWTLAEWHRRFQAAARAVPRAPRRAFLPHVGVLSAGFGSEFSLG
jgi:cyclopropane fatty-acyl-phospholipid synthase-like methyltransferase